MEKEEKKGVSETATMADGNVSTNQATVIPDTPRVYAGIEKIVATPAETTAKVIKNLDHLRAAYQKLPNRTRGFITNLSKALSLRPYSSSQYGTFLLPSGDRFTLRISNHNAKVSNFDKRQESEAISIAISHRHNKGLINDGNAHIIEYFYRKRDLEEASNLPLVQIINSIRNLLLTGEYKDTTGLAERQEVNIRKTVKERRDRHKGMRL